MAVGVRVGVAVQLAAGVTVDIARVGVAVGEGRAVRVGALGVAVGLGAAVLDGSGVAVGEDVAPGLGANVTVGVSIAVRVGVGVNCGPHPYSAAFTAPRISSMVMSPSPFPSPAGHSAKGAIPSPMFTTVISSSIDTSPSALQSPMHERGVGVPFVLGVGVGDANAATVGVSVAAPIGPGDFVVLGVADGVVGTVVLGVAVRPGVCVTLDVSTPKFAVMFSPTDTKTGMRSVVVPT